jgi:hypothetical protein
VSGEDVDERMQTSYIQCSPCFNRDLLVTIKSTAPRTSPKNSICGLIPETKYWNYSYIPTIKMTNVSPKNILS